MEAPRRLGKVGLGLFAGLALLAHPGLAQAGGEWRDGSVGPEVSGGLIGGQVTGVAFGAGVFVATAPFRLLVSRDTRKWEVIHAPARMNSVKYTEAGFLAAGNAGTLMVSKDGRHWKHYRVGRDLEWDLNEATYGNGWYLVMAAQGVVLASKDLKRWMPVLTAPRGLILGMDYGKDRLVVGGYWQLLVAEYKEEVKDMPIASVRRRGNYLDLYDERGRRIGGFG
ncbi:hypothetical protein, partial [Thermus islandicus]|uniref:hypothetical protein n=1 Tax=Thermus islandicus TaxID=540988 RepID=UPI0012EB3C0B